MRDDKDKYQMTTESKNTINVIVRVRKLLEEEEVHSQIHTVRVINNSTISVLDPSEYSSISNSLKEKGVGQNYSFDCVLEPGASQVTSIIRKRFIRRGLLKV